MAATVLGEDIESFQEMHREMKRVEDGQKRYGSVETPSTIKVKGADGEEATVDVIQPRLSDEEVQSSVLPSHMLCAACQGVAFQFAESIATTVNLPTKGEPMSGCILDALQQVCKNVTMWTDLYGLEPGLDGNNVLVGPGIVQTNEIVDSELIVHTQRSHATGSRLVGVCSIHLMEHDELEMMEHIVTGGKLDHMICRQVDQPCGPKAVKQKKSKKRKL